VLPLGTRATAAVCRLRPALERLTGLNVPAHDAFQATFDHAVCQAECVKLGIPCPRAYSLEEARDILGEGKNNTMLVVKPQTDVGASLGLNYVSNADSLLRCVADCVKRFGGAVIHEFIPGDPTLMHTALLLFDRDSRLSAAFTTRKIRQWPPSGGVTAAGISIAEKQLVEIALPFFARWRWRGPVEVECKLDPRDGRYKVIEINGRFPGYARFAMVCGLPLAVLTAGLALGGTAPRPLRFWDYEVGRKYVNPALFLRTVLADLRANPSPLAALKQAAADCAGTGAQFRSLLSDPLPVIGRLLQDVTQMAGRRPGGGLRA
jgi:predicted ATP-grasp superfamily ATP-dependent carboligase